MVIFLPISLNICFGCSKEPSHRDSSFEYPQHMFWSRNKKIIFWYALLSGGLVYTYWHFCQHHCHLHSEMYNSKNQGLPWLRFVVANTFAKWKKLKSNEIDFSQGFSQKVVSRTCPVFISLPASGDFGIC